jgi:uracil-DNA glycosylase family 4
MGDSNGPVLPPEEPKARKKGRPKIETAPVPLHTFPGSTKEEQLEGLWRMWGNCTRCFLGEIRCQQKTGQLVFGEGNPNADVLIVGEGPGEEEERHGVPFIGAAGQMLNQMIAAVSDDEEMQGLVDWYATQPRGNSKEAVAAQEKFHDKVWHWRVREFFITNVVSCRPPENRQPTLPEMKACWERLWNIIYIVDPLLIVALGNSALAAVSMKQSVQITKMRGQLFDVVYQGRVGPVTYPVMPMFHPSYLARKADWKTRDGDYAKTMEDWKKAMRVVDFLRLQHFGTPVPDRTGRL